MTDPLVSLTYVSSATDLLEVEQLLTMLAAWRPRNQARGVTGMLLYSGGNIIQALEGPEDAVATTFATIETDPRHHDVTVIVREPVAERAFPDWSMGFRHLTAGEVRDAEGFSPFLQERVRRDAPTSADSAHRMLELFRRTVR